MCLYIFYAYVCVCVDKNNNCDISAAAHLRGPGEVAHKPADYLVGPAGSPIFPTQTPAVKHILLARSVFLSPRLSLSCCSAFILHHRTPPAPSPLSHLSLVLPFFSLLLFSTSLLRLSLFPRHRANPTVHSNSCHLFAFTSSDRRNADRQVRRQILVENRPSVSK